MIAICTMWTPMDCISSGQFPCYENARATQSLFGEAFKPNEQGMWSTEENYNFSRTGDQAQSGKLNCKSAREGDATRRDATLSIKYIKGKYHHAHKPKPNALRNLVREYFR